MVAASITNLICAYWGPTCIKFSPIKRLRAKRHFQVWFAHPNLSTWKIIMVWSRLYLKRTLLNSSVYPPTLIALCNVSTPIKSSLIWSPLQQQVPKNYALIRRSGLSSSALSVRCGRQSSSLMWCSQSISQQRNCPVKILLTNSFTWKWSQFATSWCLWIPSWLASHKFYKALQCLLLQFSLLPLICWRVLYLFLGKRCGMVQLIPPTGSAQSTRKVSNWPSGSAMFKKVHFCNLNWIFKT